MSISRFGLWPKSSRPNSKRRWRKTACCHASIPRSVWQITWTINCQAIGDAEASLKYLAPYVFRVAISDNRIVDALGRDVTFSYRKSGSYRSRNITIDALEFIRRFLQHVLPSGFMKVRHFGFMNSACKVSFAWLRLLVLAALAALSFSPF